MWTMAVKAKMDVPYQSCSRCLKKGKIRCPLCHFAFYCSQECRNKDKIRHTIHCSHAQRVQQCANCKKRNLKLKYCSQCFYVFYCNSQCQKKDWVNHKTLCKQFSTVISNCTTEELTTPREALTLYLGNSLCQDYLNLKCNEGVNFIGDLNILMVGCGDIKSVVKTVTALPKKFDGNLNFVLNDLSTHSVARNILFLYLAIVEPNPEYMVQIWYSVQLNSSCLSYLKRNLLRLATKPLETILTDMKGFVNLSEEHWNRCLMVWNGWQNLETMNNLQERVKTIFLKPRHKSLEERLVKVDLAEAAHDIGQNGLLLPLKSYRRTEAQHPNISMFCFNPFKSKNFQESDYIKLNPFQQLQCPDLDEMIFGAAPAALKLPCWPWSEVQKEKCSSGDILAAYESFIQKQFSAFSDRLKKGHTNFHFIIDSFKHVRYYLEDGKRFDRICVGQLGDVYLYPRLLQQFAYLLNKENPNSVLVSHHNHWMMDLFEIIRTDLDFFAEAERLAFCDHFKLPSSDIFYLSNQWTLATSNYFDIWPYFFRFLQKQAFAYQSQEMQEKKIVHPGQIAKKFNLRLRNFHCEQNKVIPCQTPEENRIADIHPYTVTLEWTLDPKLNKD